jgi:hypothetical protein
MAETTHIFVEKTAQDLCPTRIAPFNRKKTARSGFFSLTDAESTDEQAYAA